MVCVEELLSIVGVNLFLLMDELLRLCEFKFFAVLKC